MAIPKAVQAQADRADELLKKAQETPEPQKEPVSEATENPGEIPAPVKEVKDEKGADYWKHRFDVLQGKYNAELPGLREQLQEAQQRMARMQIELEQVKESHQKAAQTRQQQETDTATLKTIRDEYGDEIANVFERMQGTIQTLESRLASELEGTKKEVNATREAAAQTAAEAYYQSLDDKVEGWREVNTDPDFHAWLEEEEGISGRTRGEILKESHESLNARRVARIFSEYKRQKEGTTKRDPRESQITPDTAGGETTPQGKPIYSRAEVKKFYEDVTKGKYRDSKRVAELDRKYSIAQAEGRIR